ncbi:sugar transporter [Nonlabens spongiae]|uniref:Sugar transporter n=1 Tax=Nonlabens spongiae TaxID=331648 RepID=A0A1W6MNZ3_9FLAO|nr:polysaccharide biosynthesis/export family protein [Nonlabens spongiae]ARN79282.1 sugar transporter [Nonlabens spongiae]
MQKLIVFLLLALLMGSCIPTKRITYLQSDGNSENDSLITIEKVQSPYRLQIGDVLSIQIQAPYDQDLIADFTKKTAGGGGGAQQVLQGGLYFTGYIIDRRGYIEMPQLGEILAVGETEEILRDRIKNLLYQKGGFKKSSDLFVSVKLEGLRYTMVGEVNSPGQNTILRDRVSIVEAVADAGGVPITGDLKNVRIIRQYEGGIKVHAIDLTTINAMNSPYYFLKPNDVLVFNPLPQKTLGTGTNGLQSFTTIISVLTTLITTYLLIDNLTSN